VRFAPVLLVASLLLVGWGGESGPKVAKVRSLPGSLVAADGHPVYFDCEGKGSPTVIFLNGWGADSSSWFNVFDESSRMTRACEYDRYGTGWTASYGVHVLPRRARDARDQARELEQLLRNADIAGPYVVVGHSWGGELARLYAGTHDDVKAVVLVDAASPGQFAAMAAALPPYKPGEPQQMEQIRHPHFSDPLANPENLAIDRSMNEAAAVTSFGGRPEIVITAGNGFAGFERLVFPVWLRLQNRLASLSTRSVHVLAPASGHFVQQDNPALVAAAVRAAVAAARDDGHLGSCAAIFGRVADHRCLP
jgi:pimeloyl-ACP methyl ester carboxylesterase